MVEENDAPQQGQDDDSRSDASSSGLPPPLVTAEDYDALVCRSCVSQIPILQAWAGTPGVAMVVRDDPDSSWKIIGALPEDHLVVDDGSETEGQNPAPVEASLPNHTYTPTKPLSGAASSSQQDPDTLQGKKRSLLNLSPSPDGPSVKRSRTSGTSFGSQKMCRAPTAHPFAQTVLAEGGAQMLGAGDIFLSGDWRKRWCLCDSCLPELRKRSYLLEVEETYEPPEDPDSSESRSPLVAGRVNNNILELSLEELGLRALERIPRDRALDGIRAFNTMRCAVDRVPQNRLT
jgi:E3 ubiquitin-protein ligase UBR7